MHRRPPLRRHAAVIDATPNMCRSALLPQCVNEKQAGVVAASAGGILTVLSLLVPGISQFLESGTIRHLGRPGEITREPRAFREVSGRIWPCLPPIASFALSFVWLKFRSTLGDAKGCGVVPCRLSWDGGVHAGPTLTSLLLERPFQLPPRVFIFLTPSSPRREIQSLSETRRPRPRHFSPGLAKAETSSRDLRPLGFTNQPFSQVDFV